MSQVYSDLYYTNFPDAIDSYSYFSDPTADDVPLIKQYQTYFNAGNIAAAAQILESNPSLQNKIINANSLNKFVDSIKAMQRLYKEDVQSYIMDLITYKGEYAVKVTYSKYDVVKYGNMVYMCISLNCPMGTLPTDTNHFVPLTLKGDQGESGTGLTPRGVWSEYVAYYANDLVALNNVLWVAKEDNIGQAPSSTSSVWYSALSLNITLTDLKIKNEDIDAIINGSAVLKDDDAFTSQEDAESITKDDIDNVLNN